MLFSISILSCGVISLVLPFILSNNVEIACVGLSINFVKKKSSFIPYDMASITHVIPSTIDFKKSLIPLCCPKSCNDLNNLPTLPAKVSAAASDSLFILVASAICLLAVS